MVIFGGFDGSTYSLLGGRYDPLQDLWSFVSPIAQPAGRANHSAVWADGQMVVWGGTNGASLSTGGRYCDCVLKAFYQDADADGHGNPAASIQACGPVAGYVATGDDCNDASAGVWSTPSETRDLVFVDNATLSWTPPAAPGAAADLYDVIRSDTPGGFQASGTCVATDTSGTSARDAAMPAAGGAFFYLVRAQDACPIGQGSVGTSSNGTPVAARSCP